MYRGGCVGVDGVDVQFGAAGEADGDPALHPARPGGGHQERFDTLYFTMYSAERQVRGARKVRAQFALSELDTLPICEAHGENMGALCPQVDSIILLRDIVISDVMG